MTSYSTTVAPDPCAGFSCSIVLTRPIPLDPSLPAGAQFPGYLTAYNVQSLAVSGPVTIPGVIVRTADLSVTKSDSPDPVLAGAPLT